MARSVIKHLNVADSLMQSLSDGIECDWGEIFQMSRPEDLVRWMKNRKNGWAMDALEKTKL